MKRLVVFELKRGRDRAEGKQGGGKERKSKREKAGSVSFSFGVLKGSGGKNKHLALT